MGNKPTIRNTAARASIMRKGGAHQPAKSRDSQALKTHLNEELSDWQDELKFERELKAILTQGEDGVLTIMILLKY